MPIRNKTYQLLLTIIEHIIICKNLLVKLLRYLLNGTKTWIGMTVRLLIFVLILMPGWFLFLRYYFFDPFIMKNIPYGLGGKERNLLDVYLPYTRTSIAEGAEKKIKKPSGPVLIFLSGGAWIIGYKMWGCLLAREFARFGYIVVVPDYRNFPQGNIEHMIADTIAAIAWTKGHIALFGGDPNQIIVSGQSAGAHIVACTIIELYKNSKYVSTTLTSQSLDKMKALGSKEKLLNAEDVAKTSVNFETPSKAAPADDEWEEWRSVSTIRKPNQPSSVSDADMSDKDYFSNPEPVDFSAADDVGIIHNVVDVVDVLDNSFEVLGRSSRASSEIEITVTIDDIKMMVGISGPYNLKALEAHFHSRGLDSAIIEWICLGDVLKYSPTHSLAEISGYTVPCQCLCQCMCSHPSISPEVVGGVVGEPVVASTAVEAVAVPARSALPSAAATARTINTTLEGFPPVALYHGCKDLTIPASVSTELSSLLEAATHEPVLRLYKDYTHTDPILEGVLAGDCKMLHDMARDMYDVLGKNRTLDHTYNVNKLFQNVDEQMKSEPSVNKFRVKIARYVNPF